MDPDTSDFKVDDFGFGGFDKSVTWETLNGEMVCKVIGQNILRFLHLTASTHSIPPHVKLIGFDPAKAVWPQKFAWSWLRYLTTDTEEIVFSIDGDGIGPAVIEMLKTARHGVDSYMVLLLIHTMTVVRQYLFAQGRICMPLAAEEAESYVDREDWQEFWGHQTIIQTEAADSDVTQAVDGIIFLYGLDRRLMQNPNLIYEPYALAQLILREPNTPVII